MQPPQIAPLKGVKLQKTAGELIPFAPPAGSTWERVHLKDQATVVKVENGNVYYTTYPEAERGAIYEMPIPVWAAQMQKSMWKRLSFLLAQAKGLELDGIEDEITPLFISHGHKLASSLRLTRMVLADYQGWTNWDTWNTALMMDNEQDSYNTARELFERGNQKAFQDWAIRTIIGPHNRQAMADAQEWNDIPEHDRLDHHYEDLKERSPGAADFVDALGFGADTGDTEPTLIDQELVNWDEIWQHLQNEVDDNAEHERTMEHLKTLTPYDIPHWNDENTQMMDAWLQHHGVNPNASSYGEDRPQSIWGHQTWVPLEHVQQGVTEYGWPHGFSDSHAQEIAQNGGWNYSTRDLGSQASHAIQRGSAGEWQIEAMTKALQAKGYTPEQIQQIMRQRYQLVDDERYPGQKKLVDMEAVPKQPDPTLDQPSDFTLPEGWTAKVSFDWTQLAESQPHMEEPQDTIFYRQDWPYDFKWCYNNKTGVPLVWQVTAGGDGRPVHRTMYEAQNWVKNDLALGQARFRPAQRTLDGNVTEPAELRILYYPSSTTLVPEPIIDWLKKVFPDAMVHCVEFSRGAMWASVRPQERLSGDPITERMLGVVPQREEDWKPSPSFPIPQQALDQAHYQHMCPMCGPGSYLRDRGGVLTCGSCPYEYPTPT